MLSTSHRADSVPSASRHLVSGAVQRKSDISHVALSVNPFCKKFFCRRN